MSKVVLCFFLIIIIHFRGVFSSNNNFLFIAVLSSPENFEKRLSLRRTWLKQLQFFSNVKYRFIVGDEICSIHPKDRLNFYGCERRRSPSEASTHAIQKSGGCHIGFTFVAHYDLVIKKLGVSTCLEGNTKVPVRVILEGVDGQYLASVVIHGPISEKSISPVFFPQHSEGLVRIQALDRVFDFNCCFTVQQNSESLSITNFVSKNGLTDYDSSSGVIPTMSAEVIETAGSERNRSNLWKNHIEEVKKDLDNEIRQHADILVVNVEEFYRNIPLKLLQFITKISYEKFDFIMKVDDDSFVDLRRVVKALSFVNFPGEMWWWSKLREYWMVPKLGKWREDEYRSVTYPPFPCGGGYVLSRGAVQHLSTIAHNLRLYQGEDVSLGIWLSGTKIKLLDFSSFDCAISYKAVMLGQCQPCCRWSCDPGKAELPCNYVQLTVVEMFRQWEEFRRGLSF